MKENQYIKTLKISILTRKSFRLQIIHIIISLKDKIFRGRSRKSIIYACITYAYRMKDLKMNKQKVLQLFQINKKSGLGGIRYLNMNIDEASKKQLSHQKHLSPVILFKM